MSCYGSSSYGECYGAEGEDCYGTATYQRPEEPAGYGAASYGAAGYGLTTSSPFAIFGLPAVLPVEIPR